jgi:hypothetical protein
MVNVPAGMTEKSVNSGISLSLNLVCADTWLLQSVAAAMPLLFTQWRVTNTVTTARMTPREKTCFSLFVAGNGKPPQDQKDVWPRLRNIKPQVTRESVENIAVGSGTAANSLLGVGNLVFSDLIVVSA